MASIAEFLQEHRLKAMFVEALGWDHASGTIDAAVDGRDLSFVSIAHKRGLQVLCCSTDRVVLMNRGMLRKFQRTIARTFHEHILIFFCEEPRKQVWQWAVRLPDGRKLRHREHPFFSDSPPPSFLNRLVGLRFSLDEEENVTLVDALDRARQVLDISAELNLFTRRPWYAQRSDELARAMQNGDAESRDRFLLFHLPLARKISRRLCRWFSMEPDDAEQIASLGLLRAARTFRPELGYQFSTYATRLIKQACHRFGPEFALAIRLPENLFWAAFPHRLDVERILCASGSGGLSEYFADLDERNPKFARQIRDFERAVSIRSLSDRNEPEYRLARNIPGSPCEPPDDAEHDEATKAIQLAVSRLRSRDAQVIRLRYGLDGPSQTLEVIGTVLGLTRERVRQIQQRAQEKLRCLLAQQIEDHEPVDDDGPYPSSEWHVEPEHSRIPIEADGKDFRCERLTIGAQKALLQRFVATMPNDL